MKSIFLVCLLFISTLLMAQNRMTPELLWELKRVGGIEVAPDYKKVLFTQRAYDLHKKSNPSYSGIGRLKGLEFRISKNLI